MFLTDFTDAQSHDWLTYIGVPRSPVRDLTHIQSNALRRKP